MAILGTLPPGAQAASLPYRLAPRLDGPAFQSGTLSPDVLDLLRRLGRPDGALQTDECLRWAQHPDEFVRWSLLSAKGSQLAYVSDWPQRARPKHAAADPREYLVRRAVLEANAEGRVWTPMLDVLGPTVYRTMAFTHDRSCDVDRYIPSGPSEIWRRLGAMRDWVAAQAEWAALEPLLAFETPAVRHLIAAHATCLTSFVVAGHFMGSDETVLALADNGALPDDVRSTVGVRILELYLEDRADTGGSRPLAALRQMGAALQGFSPAMRAFLREARKEQARYRRANPYRLALAHLADPGSEPDALESVMTPAWSLDEARAAYLLHPATSDPVRRRLVGGGVEGAATATRALEMTPPQAILDLILDERASDTQTVRLLASERRGTAETWRRIARETRSTVVKVELAHNAAARRDPETLALLLKSGLPSVLAPLATAAPRGEIRRIVRLSAAADPEGTLHILESLSDAARRLIRRTDLTPMFGALSGNDTVRLLALLPDVDQPETETAPLPPRQGRR